MISNFQRPRMLSLLGATALTVCAIPAIAQQDLVTRDRVGPADAENALTFRLTAYDLYSADTATAEGFEALFTDFINAHPGWRIDTQLQTGNLNEEQARILEQAQAGRGPDCAMIDSAQLATFKEAGVLSPMNDYFTDEEIADLFPYVREGVTDADGNIVAAMVVHRPACCSIAIPQWSPTRPRPGKKHRLPPSHRRAGL